LQGWEMISRRAGFKNVQDSLDGPRDFPVDNTARGPRGQ
jgi:hypothetical protein